MLSKGLFWPLYHKIEPHPTSWQYLLKYYLDPGWDREALLPPIVPPMRDRDRPERPLSGVTTGVPEFFLPGRARELNSCKLKFISTIFLWRRAIFSKAIYRLNCFFCTLFQICKFTAEIICLYGYCLSYPFLNQQQKYSDLLFKEVFLLPFELIDRKVKLISTISWFQFKIHIAKDQSLNKKKEILAYNIKYFGEYFCYEFSDRKVTNMDYNVWVAEKVTKNSSNTLLHLVTFSATQTLVFSSNVPKASMKLHMSYNTVQLGIFYKNKLYFTRCSLL